VISVRVPLDLHAVAATGCGAFAAATPLRVRDLLALAVRQAIGKRASREMAARALTGTLHGLNARRFTLEIDGRRFHRSDDVVVCSDVARIRFFLPARRPVHR